MAKEFMCMYIYIRFKMFLFYESAGSFIWNAAGETHATRVYDEPFISVFVWLENVNSPCNVIKSDDWPKIEQDLAK